MWRRLVAQLVFLGHEIEPVKVIGAPGVGTLMYVEVLTLFLKFQCLSTEGAEEDEIFQVTVFLVESVFADFA